MLQKIIVILIFVSVDFANKCCKNCCCCDDDVLESNGSAIGSNDAVLSPTLELYKVTDGGKSSVTERVLEAIESFETLYDQHQNSIKDYRSKHDYLILSDSEGKYFNIYAWLRVGGVIKKYDFKNPRYVYFNLEGLKSGKIEFSNASPAEGFNGPKENIYKPHEDASPSGKWFRIPKLELTEDYNVKTLCHIGDFVDRGRNSLSSLLTLVYLKKIVCDAGSSDVLRIIFGNHEFAVYSGLSEEYKDLTKEGLKASNVKGDILCKLCQIAVQQDLFVFGDVIDINNNKIILVHKTLTEQDLEYLSKVLGGVYNAGNIYEKIKDINSKIKEKCSDLGFMKDLMQKICCEPSNYISDGGVNCISNQINGHIHKHFEKSKKSNYLSWLTGNYLEDKNILFVDNWSTTDVDRGSHVGDGRRGMSKASIFGLDKGKELKDFSLCIFVDDKKGADNGKFFLYNR